MSPTQTTIPSEHRIRQDLVLLKDKSKNLISLRSAQRKYLMEVLTWLHHRGQAVTPEALYQQFSLQHKITEPCPPYEDISEFSYRLVNRLSANHIELERQDQLITELIIQAGQALPHKLLDYILEDAESQLKKTEHGY